MIYKIHPVDGRNQTNCYFHDFGKQAKGSAGKGRNCRPHLPLGEGLLGDVSPVGQGVSEFRIHYGPGYRVYFQQRGTEIVILLCGGDKSSQSRDIETAKHLADEWRPQ
ncbi:type II toxin-antitoxin system RelE/ParE family toxin [Pseudomonas sp. S3E17]|uniref:type II toxin-antitoxin system RelE/ParE family toxin n=1 Tax=Pseudomonas sp. S3E17 TaxID=2817893 RepID=UPI00209C74E4